MNTIFRQCFFFLIKIPCLDSILDIKDWVEKAVQGENNRAWKTFHTHWMNVLLNDESFTDGIPSNKADFVNLITARSDYKNAKDKFRRQ